MKVEVYHNTSRDASFGLNVVFDSGKREAQAPGERHPLVKVFEYQVPEEIVRVCSGHELLDQAWCSFNNGSGQEDPAYFDRRLRSLSIGDVLVLDGEAYSVEKNGFRARRDGELKVVDPFAGELLVRERYDFLPEEELCVTVPWTECTCGSVSFHAYSCPLGPDLMKEA